MSRVNPPTAACVCRVRVRTEEEQKLEVAVAQHCGCLMPLKLKEEVKDVTISQIKSFTLDVSVA